jgi:hypothetical protein
VPAALARHTTLCNSIATPGLRPAQATGGGTVTGDPLFEPADGAASGVLDTADREASARRRQGRPRRQARARGPDTAGLTHGTWTHGRHDVCLAAGRIVSVVVPLPELNALLPL